MRPPVLARLLLLALAPSERRSEIDGDLLEGYTRRATRLGRARARRWYWAQLVTFDVFRLRALRDPRRDLAAPDTDRPRETSAMFLQEMRQAARGLARNRRYLVAAVTVLAVGIGAATSVFTLVNGVLLRPLPYRDADRLVMAFRTVPLFGFTRSTVSYPDFLDWRQVRSFDDLAAYAQGERTWRGADAPELWRGAWVTGNLLSMLGVRAALGRVIREDDAKPGAPAVVVLSHALWQSRFGGRADVVGGAVHLGDADVTVIGVLPAGFAFPSSDTEIWLPLGGDVASAPRDRNFLSVIGRLAPGVSVAAAQRELSAAAARIDGEAPDGNRGYGVFVERRQDFTVRNARSALLAFQLTVMLVLALACGCVANLMLSRAAGRRREMAVRAALGASRGRLARHALAEATLVSLGGGLLGVALAQGIARLVVRFGSGQLPRLEEITLDARVLGVSLLVTLGCGILCGLAPALQVGRDSLAAWTRVSAGVVGASGRHRVQNALVVAQFALTVVLLIGAGLLAASFVRLTAVEPGFDPSGVVAGQVSIPSAQMRDGVTARDRLFGELARRVRALPGVSSVGLTFSLPFSSAGFSSQMLPDATPGDVEQAPSIQGSVVAGDYFAAMGMTLLQGRDFTADDRSDAQRVILVSRALADRFWPGQDPIGRRVREGNGPEDVATVIGMVSDVHQQSLATPPVPMFYLPLAQAGPWASALYLVARSSDAPEALVPLIRRELAAVAPGLPLAHVAVADALIRRTVAAPRFRALAFSLLGAFAVLLAVAGVYGVVSLGVAERTREIGVRLALGADRSRVTAMVVRRGVILAAIGVLLGLLGATAATRVLDSLLFGVPPRDLWTFAGAAMALVAIAAMASFIPARRAARVDPLVALRDG
jgi:predicted permease